MELTKSKWARDAARPPISDALIDALLWTPPETGDGTWGIVPYFEGLPGVAKTDRLRRYARRFRDWPSKLLAAGRLGEAAFAAVPVPWQYPGDEYPTMIYPPPAWVRPFERAASIGGLLILDEYTTSRGLDPYLMGLTLSGVVGEYELPKRVRVVALGNPLYLAAQGRELSQPERNRMVYLPWGPPTVEDRAAWQMGASAPEAEPDDPAERERRTLAAWPVHYARAKSLEAGFLRSHPSLKNVEPSETEHAFATDRSWSMATRGLASAWLHGLSDAETSAILRGSVGETVAASYGLFLTENRVDAPADVLASAASVAGHDPYAHADRAYVFLTNCAHYLATVPPDAQPEKCAAMHALLARYAARHADLARLCAEAIGGGGAGRAFHAALKGDAGKSARANLAELQRI